MAIAAGSIVSPKISLAPVVQGPMFGVVESGTSGVGPFVVLWANGNRVEDIDLVTVAEILSGDGVTAATLVGRHVRPTSPAGQTNWGSCICVAVYKRGGVDYALLQNPASEYFIEVLASQCEVVT